MWSRLREALGNVRRAAGLLVATSPTLTAVLVAASLLAGAIPAGIAWVGKLIVDGVLLAAETGDPADQRAALGWVGVELALVAGASLVQRSNQTAESLLRALLGQRVNELILEKALTLELTDFEDAAFYDRMTRARREASSRPLSLVRRGLGVAQNGTSLLAYGALLLALGPVVVIVLALAAVPAFLVETRFSRDAFRLFRWRSPETRKQTYLETVLAREDHAKEVKLFDLGPMLLDRYRSIFRTIFREDRALTLRRGAWGFLLGLLSTTAFYGVYGWIAMETIDGRLSLGEMTMYLLVFKQGQAALAAILAAVGGAYEDTLYLSNLYEFLDHRSRDRPVLPAAEAVGSAVDLDRGVDADAAVGPDPADGLRFDEVVFTYPGAPRPAIDGLSLHLPPGHKLALVGENGAGKTTLIKLLAGLYQPSAGRVLLEGRDLRDWDPAALRRRIGVIFQDFVRYQLTVGENVGVGDVDELDDEVRWRRASEKGMAEPFIARLPEAYQTQLGRWFKDGQELSLGQWQKIALSRAFMREGADILVLDGPTASMGARAEAEVFERFRSLTQGKTAILISHRFSTVRMADTIAVLEHGRVIEEGSHAALLEWDGTYAALFRLQARGYR